ncbi:MAG: PRD domain-containing protein [Lachnospiraceae bacterium]|nr:PRD domain-containing protein [Lachnospiraceae bacterium]
MFRIKKVLNHNSVIAIGEGDNKEYLVMGKGIAFGKKVTERIETGTENTVYSLHELNTDRGAASDIIKTVSPECLELANEVLNRAEKEFGQIDRSILFPMADHIAFAVHRIRNNEQISNPLTEDIRILFYKEYKVAECMKQLITDMLGVEIDEHEIGYIALHVHSAIEEEKVSQAMQVARAVRECISLVEKQTGKKIDVMSLSYNRLMNHIRYMIARSLSGEKLKVSMNDYMEIKFPEAYKMAVKVCDEIEKNLKLKLENVEIGYLAIHIERVMDNELSE